MTPKIILRLEFAINKSFLNVLIVKEIMSFQYASHKHHTFFFRSEPRIANNNKYKYRHQDDII